MSFLGDALGFERSHIADLWSGIKRDPKRLVLGVDPLSTAGWNFVLGRDDEPLVNQLGGPTEQNYQNAEARGINTGAGRTLHGIAGTIAGAYGGQAAGSALGAGGSNTAMTGARVGSGGFPNMNQSAQPPYTPPRNAPPPFVKDEKSSKQDRARRLVQILLMRGAM